MKQTNVTTSNNVIVTGGTAAQQQIIQAAHATAITSLGAAANAASAGSGNFSTWFGTDTSQAHTKVQLQFNLLQQALQNYTFTYDLANQLTDQLISPKIYVTFIYHDPANPANQQVDGYLWSGFWSLNTLNNADAQALLVQSVAAQASSFVAGNPIADFSSTFTEQQAKQLAKVDPATALASLRNMLYYLGGYITVQQAAAALHSQPGHHLPHLFHQDLHPVIGRMFSVSKIMNQLNKMADKPSEPKSSKTVNYAWDGITSTEIINCDLTNVSTNLAGEINGGKISIQSATPPGSLIDKGNLLIDENGNPATANFTLFSLDGHSVTGYVNADYTGLNFDSQRAISGGNLKVSTLDDNLIPVVNSEVVFAAGNPATGHFVHFAVNGIAIDKYSTVDYSKAIYIEHQLVSGSIKVTETNPENQMLAIIKFSYMQGGVLNLSQTTNYDPQKKQVSSYVTTSFSKVVFGSNHHILSGDLLTSVYRTNGSLRSKTILTYENGNPVHMKTVSYQANGLVRAKSDLSYQHARFNSQKKVINSSVTVQTTDGTNQLLSRSIINYDGFGKTRTIQTSTYDKKGFHVVKRSEVDYSYAVFSSNNRVNSGTVICVTKNSHGRLMSNSLTTHNLSGETQEETYLYPDDNQHPKKYTKTIRRSDGTIAEILKLSLDQNGHPVSGQINYYDNSGKIILKTTALDFTQLSFQKKTIKGKINISSSISNIKRSETQVSY